MNQIRITYDPSCPILTAVGYLAAIAYPKDIEKADRFVRTYRTVILKSALGNERVNPEFRPLSNRDCVNAANKGIAIIAKNRIPALVMAARQITGTENPDGTIFPALNLNGALQEFVDRMASPLGTTGKAISRIKNISARTYQGATKNVYRDAWRPSQPALAMTAALPLGLIITEKFPGDKPADSFAKVSALAKMEGWVEDAVTRAAALAPAMAQFFGPQNIPLLVPPDDTVPLRYTK